MYRLEARNAQHKLTKTEEQTIINTYSTSIGEDFCPGYARWQTWPINHWAERFVTRSDELKMAFNRAKER
jgi:hypothetical protein